MNEDIKQDWLKALRSGEYKQAAGYLEINETGKDDDTCNCCLGVLCDLAVKAGVISRDTDRAFPTAGEPGFLVFFGRAGDDNDSSSAILPQSVRDWADVGGNPFIEIDPKIFPEQEERETFRLRPGETVAQASLADLNDGGLTFAQIADVIEAQL